MPELVVSDWKLIRLTLEDLGPFRQGQQRFEFFGVDTENNTPTGAGPANLYMLLAKNAHGKTTVMDTISGLFGLLNEPPVGRFSVFPTSGRAQLDMRGTWTVDGRSQTVLLSLWTGSEGPLHTWAEEEMVEVAQAQIWAKLGLTAIPKGVWTAEDTNELGELLLKTVRAQLGEPPTQLFGESQTLPTVLYFPAERRVVAPKDIGAVARPDKWGYQPSQIFESDGPDWGSSIDNVLVWLEWLGDRRLDELLDFLNEILFRDDDGKRLLKPHREELRTYVQTRYGIHSLAALSHGERAILQIMARTLTHMTSNTIILIDEVEIHLHSRWMNRMYEAMKSLLRKYPSFTVVFTTHNRELIQVFRHRVKEEGLVKGGFLIEDEIQ
ncbi:AAA family ATPase [Mesorhizobium sp. RIZ17]|uniref:AAA family ATPase n=1 Tax=Mesorhizobium TaxID=68287 RepID=UPI003DA9491E